MEIVKQQISCICSTLTDYKQFAEIVDFVKCQQRVYQNSKDEREILDGIKSRGFSVHIIDTPYLNRNKNSKEWEGIEFGYLKYYVTVYGTRRASFDDNNSDDDYDDKFEYDNIFIYGPDYDQHSWVKLTNFTYNHRDDILLSIAGYNKNDPWRRDDGCGEGCTRRGFVYVFLYYKPDLVDQTNQMWKSLSKRLIIGFKS